MNLKEIIAEVQLQLHATEHLIKMSSDTYISHQHGEENIQYQV